MCKRIQDVGVWVVYRGPADGVHLKRVKPGQISLCTQFQLLSHKVAQLLQISEEYSHLAVGKVEVVTHLHRERSPAAAAEAHDAVLAPSVRHIVDSEHSLASRVCLKETKNNLSQLKKKHFVLKCTGVRVFSPL